MKDITPLVGIKCLAYNHEPYIRQCLEGFIMQKTNFHFIAIVHDDASTDGTAAIIKEYAEKYPNIIKPIYESENQYSKRDGSLRKIMRRAIDEIGCKYIAFCEGDDYWTDPLKLQKQVDFLEVNTDYGLIFSDYQLIDYKGEKIEDNCIPDLYKNMKRHISDGLILGKLFSKPSGILTCTIMTRAKYDNKENFWIDHDRFMYIASKFHVKYLPDITASYRINPNGMMRSNSKIVQELLFKTISKYMMAYYKGELVGDLYSKKDLNKDVRYFFSIYFTAWLKNRYNANIKTIISCIKVDYTLVFTTPFFIVKRLINRL